MQGHNSVSADQLRSIIERVERLNEEKAALVADISEVFKEAKGNGFDVRAIKAILKERAMDASARAEQEAILDLYRNALGMLSDTPLGKAALERVSNG